MGLIDTIGTMADSTGLLVFTVENIRLAVDLEHVDRVVRAASLSPLPGAPDTIMGLLNLNGNPVPIVNLRKRLKLEEREIDTTDEIIIIKRPQGLLGVIVDEVEDVTQVKTIVSLSETVQLKHLRGATEIQGGIVLVHDIEQFLSPGEELSLADALTRGSLD